MSLEALVEQYPLMAEKLGLNDSLAELQSLRRLKEILRTLLDQRATIEEFHQAIAAVIEKGK